MKRILQVVDNMDMGGIQMFIMNVYRHIDRKKIQFDFLVFKSHKQIFEDEIKSLGGNIYKLPSRREGIIKNKKSIRNFFRCHKEYDVIHYNASSLSDIGALKCAYKNKLPVRIIHSHSSNAPGNRIHKYIHMYNKIKIHKYANFYLSCGDLASKWFYNGLDIFDCVKIVNNGIDCKNFEFSQSIRDNMRERLHISDYYVIGNVGRFAEVKNQKFIIEMFSVLKKIHPSLKICVLLVGDGPTLEMVKKIAKESNVDNDVLFLGNRSDISSLLQAMDSMVIPSLYEGFPVTAIEAQASGLPCFISDTVTNSVAIKDNVHMISLNNSYEYWIDKILKDKRRITDNSLLLKYGFDVSKTIEELMKIYYSKGN